VLTAARQHFAGTLDRKQHVAELAIFIEPAPGAAFRLAERITLAS